MGANRQPGADIPTGLTEAVRIHASDWFPALRDPVVVVPGSVLRRPTCMLVRFTVRSAEDKHDVIAKIRTARGVRRHGGEEGRPELAPAVPISARERAVRELEGLRRAARAVQAASAGPGPLRFGIVRPLLLLEEHATIVMDFVDQPNLRSVLLDHSRFAVHRRVPSGPSHGLGPWRAAGAWLRLYQLPEDPSLPARSRSSTEIVDQLGQLGQYLGVRVRDPKLSHRVQTIADGLAAAVPDELPLGVSHGDFAARNLLVGDDGRVTVLDPMPRWRAPVYDDLARLVISIRASGVQLASGGLALSERLLDDVEQAVLEGYFEERPVPWLEVTLFQLLILLDAWAGLASSQTRHPVRRLLTWSMHRQYHREARRLILALEGRLSGATTPRRPGGTW